MENPKKRNWKVLTSEYLAVGSPTINNQMLPTIASFLCYLKGLTAKGHKAFAFGSYGWSGEATRLIEDRLRGLKMRVPLEGLRIKLVPDQNELDACHHLGENLARHLTGRVEHREIDLSSLV